MWINRSSWNATAILGIALAWHATALTAQTPPADESVVEDDWSPKLELHGFGSWAYGKTDANSFLTGSEDGEYAHSQFALNIAAEPYQNLRIRGQLEAVVDPEETELELDYAFAEWRFSDAFRLRMGQVQQPFGLYNEIYDVGTLRPFLSLPQVIYGPVELLAESYQGIGLTGNVDLRSRWHLEYDVYGGGIDVRAIEALGFLEEEAEEGDTEPVKDVLGGRLSLASPSDRLSIGVSGYTGTEIDEGEAARQEGVAAHVQFLTDSLWLRGELGRHDDPFGTGIGGYVEAAYFLTPKWQLASRYERSDFDLEEEPDAAFDSLLEHRDLAIGVNYWFNPHMVVKASLHEVDGNRFARPDDAAELLEALADGTLSTETRLFAFGINFSF